MAPKKERVEPEPRIRVKNLASLTEPNPIHNVTVQSLSWDTDLFKCPVNYCKFSSDSLRDSITHLQHDFATFYNCPYCQCPSHSSEALCRHIFGVHGASKYKCGFCSYRAVTRAQVFLHQEDTHAEQQGKILVGKSGSWDEPPVPVPLSEKIQKYACTCGYTSVLKQNFLSHLNITKVNHNCALCGSYDLTESEDSVLFHFGSHGINYLQCAFCAFSSDNLAKIKFHFHKIHFQRHPFAVMRLDYEENPTMFSQRYYQLGKLDVDGVSLYVLDLSSDTNIASLCYNTLDTDSDTIKSEFEEIKRHFDALEGVVRNPHCSRVFEQFILKKTREAESLNPIHEVDNAQDTTLHPEKCVDVPEKITGADSSGSDSSGSSDSSASEDNEENELVKTSYCCHLCSFRCSSIHRFSVHLDYHFDPKSLTLVFCAQCGKAFSNVDNFMVHTSRHCPGPYSDQLCYVDSPHSAPYLLFCHCGEQSTCMSTFIFHLGKSHSVVGRYEAYKGSLQYCCPLSDCKTPFATRELLTGHYSRHSSIYSCLECQMIASSVQILRDAHIKMNTTMNHVFIKCSPSDKNIYFQTSMKTSYYSIGKTLVNVPAKIPNQTSTVSQTARKSTGGKRK